MTTERGLGCRFTCANPLRDNSVAETLMGEAKAVVAQLMSKAFPSGLPQAASSQSSTNINAI